MKYRRGIPVEKATERELLRWQMEQMAKESGGVDPDRCATAMAGLYSSFQNGYAIWFLIFAIILQLVVNILVLIVKLRRCER